jgi:hypothetical protein
MFFHIITTEVIICREDKLSRNWRVKGMKILKEM